VLRLNSSSYFLFISLILSKESFCSTFIRPSQFSTIGGQTRNRIARLNADGTLDTTFNPNANNYVYSIATQSDGKILVGGLFTSIGGQTRNKIARLNTDGTADSTFDPNADSIVFSIATQSDGKILVGGIFTNIGGQTRNRIARLNADGTLDSTFDPNADNGVYSIAIQSDGKILVGGAFTSIGIGGQPRNYIARLTNDTPALQSLTVNAGGITWTRNGSAPQFNRVTFEQSTNNGSTWTLLGNGTPSLANLRQKESLLAPTASGYNLNGLSIPSRQNVLIRATGYSNVGSFNGSQTAEELVKNVFLLSPTAANVSVSGRVLTTVGRGLRNTEVSLTDSRGNTRIVRTSSFGYYQFDELNAGETVVITVNSKLYHYQPKVVTINESLTDYDFVPIVSAKSAFR
jgi:uncharacterized delta-60 repeat protein